MNRLQGSPPASQVQARKLVLERFAGLFERQVRMYQFVDSISDLVRATHAEIATCLQDTMRNVELLKVEDDEKNHLNDTARKMMERFDRLDRTLKILLHERLKLRGTDSADLKHIMQETNRAAQLLETTLIEKDLFERHSEVIESIVLSRDKVTNWKDYMLEILTGFQSVLSFDYLFVAHFDRNILLVSIFYLDHCCEEKKFQARTRLGPEILSQLSLSPDTAWDVEEFSIFGSENASCNDVQEQINTISVSVPSLDATSIDGLLGIAYPAGGGTTAQHPTLIRSILSVMVMVVGSSKALGRTLSELEYYSNHDTLTGLYNRRYFNEVLSDEMSRSERHGHALSLLMLDLDDFKDINDSYGHPVGDRVLQVVAEITRTVLRKGDVATRIGGDEFAILLTETGTEGASTVAEKLREQIHDHVFEDAAGRRFHISVSIGVVTYPDNAKSIADLMAGVDMGLYRAKEMGKNGVVTLESVRELLSVNRKARDNVERLRASLKEGRIFPYYQPIFDCRSGAIYAYETLARMRELNGEVVTAGVFIEAIEKYGLNRELDKTIIQQALTHLARGLPNKRPKPLLFINLSAREIQGRGILSYAEKLCAELGVSPSSVVFEILERDAIGDMTRMRKFLSELRAKGFLFALDDFGSGYNSFHYLRELTFDFVKIDGAFVKNIVHSRVDHALVRNLVQLCRDLGIKTIAEFVETEEILLALKEMDVDYIQGFHLGFPAEKFIAVA
jgi:diguanylate cyclase (GGDEF)-like protein